MKRETEEWLKIAEEDFKAAEHLFAISLFRMVCYHAQQAVEKILKAALAEQGVELFRTHNILDLRNAVKEGGHELPIDTDDAIFLNGVYKARYPAAFGLLLSGEPTKEDAEKAAYIARKMWEWIKDNPVGLRVEAKR